MITRVKRGAKLAHGEKVIAKIPAPSGEIERATLNDRRSGAKSSGSGSETRDCRKSGCELATGSGFGRDFSRIFLTCFHTSKKF